MTLFLILAALMVLAAIVLLYFGTAPVNAGETDQNRSNLQIFRQRLTELETEKSQGMIDQKTVDALKVESAKTLFSDWSEKQSAVVAKASKTPFISVLALLIPLVAVLLYNQLGRYELVDYVESKPQPVVSSGDDMALIAKLAERLENDPNRLEGWLLLGQSYRSVGRYDEALAAYQKGRAHFPESLPLLVSEVEIRLYVSNGRTDDSLSLLIEKGLLAEPKNARLLLYQGLVLFQQGEGERAVAQWQALIDGVDPESKLYAQLRAVIEQGQAQLKGTAPDLTPPPVVTVSLAISVHLSPSAAGAVSTDDTVYIYAKATRGPPMPVAIKKVRVGDLPLQLTLSDADGLMPTNKLSSQSEVLVGAHISTSGQAVRQAGDWVATAVLIDLVNAKPIQLVIDQEHL